VKEKSGRSSEQPKPDDTVGPLITTTTVVNEEYESVKGQNTFAYSYNHV